MVIQQDNMGEAIELTKVHLFSLIGIGATFVMDLESTVRLIMVVIIGLSVVYYNYHRGQSQKADKELKDRQRELLDKIKEK